MCTSVQGTCSHYGRLLEGWHIEGQKGGDVESDSRLVRRTYKLPHTRSHTQGQAKEEMDAVLSGKPLLNSLRIPKLPTRDMFMGRFSDTNLVRALPL